ncbi:MAG: hypothetical protein CMF12_06945 [Idiomarina sp.]|uniref:hypothetical protein n=1 Tax=Idiomarina sp. TaxID=1874361 RepID=UPI000C61B425|nr:hypothetical protein [Idiomarina sp.]MBT42247.1 hypothetical protein [Idiomarina sp.]
MKSTKIEKTPLSLTDIKYRTPPFDKKRLLGVGHPRFGSGYLSKVLSAAGLQVGHERVRADGAVSWMFAVSDWVYPYGDRHSGHYTSFEFNFIFIRNPFSALPSCVRENRAVNSFKFRRWHIYNAFGVDINEFENEFDRAAISIIYWYKLCEQANPQTFVNIDNKESLRGFLAACGVHDNELIEEALKIPSSNTSAQKWGIAQHERILSKETLKKMSPMVLEKLIALAETYGYVEYVKTLKNTL